jgi:hypothetical protein
MKKYLRKQRMNKKGNAWVWIGLGFLVALGILITILIIIINQNPEKQKDQSNTLNNMDIYLIATDSQFPTFLNGKYILLNNSNYIQGDIVKDAFTEIKNVSNNHVDILCQSAGYYSNEINYNFTSQDKSFNSSKITCPLNKIGMIQVTSKGQLSDGNINLILLARGYYQNIQLCTAWSSGIINVQLNYNETNIPNRYKGLVDRCYDLNLSLKDDSITIPVKIKSDTLNNDAINFYVFDQDLQFNNKFELMSEKGNDNYGNPTDVIYVLRDK